MQVVRYVFDLHLSKAQLLEYYSGSVNWVQAQSLCGRSLRFRLSHLKPFVTSSGISGRFVLIANARGEFQSLSRLNGIK